MIYFSYQFLQTQYNKTIEIGDLLYMNSMKKYATMMTLLSLLYSTPYGMAADADSFRTEEYKGMGDNVLDLVHAADAYAQGYTGKGVTVGVADSPVNFVHPEFGGKQHSGVVHDELNGDYAGLPWNSLWHGTHVTGIIGADKDGHGMHGAAFDADLAASALSDEYGNYYVTDTIYDYYISRPDIKIINNSWGTAAYLVNVPGSDYYSWLRDEYYNLDDTVPAIKAAVQADKLLVFAAGNGGHLMAGLETMIDIFEEDKQFSDNVLTVAAVRQGSFHPDAGGFKADSDGIGIFSDMAMYDEDSTVSAPGYHINSANADFAASGESYILNSGTSMAAPIVSGVGALVQQAFPYLSGKQIGDVLLSTANKNITSEDGYFITEQRDYGEKAFFTFNILYTGTAPTDREALLQAVLKYYENMTDEDKSYMFCTPDGKEIWYPPSVEKLEEVLRESEYMNICSYSNVPLDVIFGQGIVDAAKAVNGLGAINVRRLDKSDISDEYTVKGIEGKTAQALYTVDTQGYSSVWSNDISEVRAGYIAENPLTGESSVGADSDNSGYDDTASDFEETFAGVTDLHDRWNFYMNSGNIFDQFDKPSDHQFDNWMTEEYIKIYNNMMKDTGLIGLHGGLKKTGLGTLALTGNNTYKGASIAAGGTLQIDGSVAGDAYSEGDGTIAGSGIINGSLYNNGMVEAGSWGAATDEETNTALQLTVKGNLEGNGTIAVNTDGMYYAKIQVDGTANLKEMSLKAGTFAAPEVGGTFLAAGSINGIESLNTDFSGLLNSEVQQKDNTITLTTTASNNAGIAADQFAALNGLFGALNEDEQKDMFRLYALDNDDLKSAMTAQNQSAGMHLELAYDAMQNRDVRQAVRQQGRTDREDAVWAITGKGWGSMDDGLKRHSWNAAVGYDFCDDGDAYAGALVAYSDNSLSGYDADGTYKNYSIGLYGGTKNRPGTATAYVSYGRQENELTRYLGSSFSYRGASSKVTSDYDSTVFGVGATYAYDLHYGKDAGWHVSPYVGLDYAHYQQDSFGEDGSVFALRSSGFSDNYLAGELGVDMKRETNDKTYGLSVAYRRVFDGDVQHTGFSYAKGKGPGFGVQSMNRSKDHVIASAYASAKLSDRWEIGGAVEQDWSHTSRDLSAAVNVAYRF